MVTLFTYPLIFIVSGNNMLLLWDVITCCHYATRGYRDVIQTSINYGVDVSVMDEVTQDITQHFLQCYNFKQHKLGWYLIMVKIKRWKLGLDTLSLHTQI